jgi:small subunit ribosomal protein S14
MAKKSMIARDQKRFILYTKYRIKRTELKLEMNNASSMEEKLLIHRKLQKLPLNSSPTRLHNRCSVTGRPKGYFRDFGLSRHVLREYASAGLLPGVVKSSW